MQSWYICFFLFVLGLAWASLINLKAEILVELLTNANTGRERIIKLSIKLNPLFRPFRRHLQYRFDSRIKPSVEDIFQKVELFIAKLQQYNRAGYTSQIAMLDVIMAGRRKLRLDRLEWKTFIGLGNAMDTAICSGALWAVKGNIIALMSARHALDLIKVEVKPDFSETKLDSRLYCIVKMRLVHIIVIVVRMMLQEGVRGKK